MTWRHAFFATVALVGVPRAGEAQDVVLSGPSSPVAWSHSYDLTCRGGRDYSLILRQEGHGPIDLAVHHGGKVEQVTGATLLAETSGLDLYSVHMDCTENGAEFITFLWTPTGRLSKQMIVVNDVNGVRALPIAVLRKR